MILSHPALLALAALAVPIVVAFLRHPPRRRVLVSSLLLARALATRTAQRRRPPPRELLALLLMLCALGVLTAALSTRPAAPRDVVVLLDTSASMAAGTPSRLERARGALAELVSAHRGAAFTVVTTAPAGVQAAGVTDPQELSERLTRLPPSGTDGNVGPLLAGICAAETQLADPPLLVGLTDSYTATQLAGFGCAVRVPDLGVDPANRGITALSANPLGALGRQAVRVSVEPGGPHTVALAAVPAAVPAEETSTDPAAPGELGEISVDGTAWLELWLPPEHALTARLTGDDSWAADDTAEVTPAAVPPVRTRLVTDDPGGYLATALRLHPRVELDVTPPDAPASAPVDLLVLEAAPVALPSAPRLVAFGPDAAGAAGLQTGRRIRSPIVTAAADPLLRHVELEGLHIAEGRALQPPGDAKALLTSDQGPLIVRGRVGERDVLATGFSLARSDLPLRVGFANLVANLVEWSAPPAAPGAASGVLSIDQTVARLDEPTPSAPTQAPLRPDFRAASGLAAVLLLIEWLLRLRRPIGGHLIRLAIAALLLAAAADPRKGREAHRQTVVFAVDRSASIPPGELERATREIAAARAALPPQARAGLVLFDDTPTVDGWPGRPWELPAIAPIGARTDLAGGLSTALALIPRGERGRVEVWTDGRGDPGDAATRAIDRGVTVTTHVLDPAHPEPGVAALEVDDDRPAAGETLSGTLAVDGGAGWTGEVVVSIDDAELTRIPVSLKADARASFPLSLPLPADLPAGFTVLTASLEPRPGEERIDSETARRGITVTRPQRVRLVTGEPGAARALARLWTAEGLTVDPATPPDAAPTSATDLVVLVDVPTEGRGALPRAAVAALETFVRDGGGLITVGGPRSYDAGGWSTSRLADLLPVRIDPDGAVKEPAATLLMVFDKSGSMARPAGRGGGSAALMSGIAAELGGGRPPGSKIRLAGEGALAALERLRDVDRLGVLAVDTRPYWPVPVQSAADREGARARILQIGAGGGGISLTTALIEARAVLSAEETALRHMVLFADAGDVGEQRSNTTSAEEQVAAMRTDGLTLSVIALGTDRSLDAGFLRALTEAGGGRFHLADDGTDLPALFAQETQQLLGSGLEEGPLQIRAVQERWHPATSDIPWSSAPPLSGHNRVERRPNTRVLLASDEGAPLLAIWQVGEGVVAAMTTDAGARWATDWLRWEGFPRLWVQLARHAARGSTDDGGRVAITVEDDRPRLTVLGRHPTATAIGPEGPVAVPLSFDGPGVWSGTWSAPPGTRWRVDVEEPDAPSTTREWVAPPSAERRHRTPDAATLETLSVTPQPPPPRRERAPLWPWLLGAAAALLPIDAFARRAVTGSGSGGHHPTTGTGGGGSIFSTQ